MEERGQRMERMVDTYENADAVRRHETNNVTENNDSTGNLQNQNAGRDIAKRRLTAASLLVHLCVILLVGVIMLGVTFNTQTTAINQLRTNLTNLNISREQLQNRYDNLSTRYDQLQIKYSNLTLSTELLQTSYDNLSISNKWLQLRYDNVTIRGVQLQMSYDNLIQRYDQLNTSYSNVMLSREQLQTSYDNLTTRYDQLQIEYTNLTLSTELLQTSYDNLSISNKWLQLRYDNVTIRGVQLQMSYDNLTQRYDQLNTSYSNMMLSREQLQISYDKLTVEQRQLTSSYNNLTEDRNQLQKERNELNSSLSAVVRTVKPGWFFYNSSLYYFSTVAASWGMAEQDCRSKGVNLVIINSREEQAFVETLRFRQAAWIGLSDQDVEGHWKWVDGSELTVRFWASQEPNNYNGTENCVITGYGAPPTDVLNTWNDYSCNGQYIWICEQQISL